MENNFETIVKSRMKHTEKVVNLITLADHKKKLVKTNWLEFITLMECLAEKHLRRYNALNLITIIAGILIPVTLNTIPDTNIATLTGTVLGVLVSVSATINQSYKFNDRWRHYRSIAEELKIEGEKYLTLSEKYKDYDNYDNNAFKLFMTNIEAIKGRQINTFMRNVTRSESRQNKSKEAT